MHPDDEHLLVVRTIEDADPPAFGKPARRAPKKIVLQFLGAGLFETENLAPLRVDPGHDVPDRAVFAGGIHSLKDQEQRIAAGRIVQAVAANSTPQRVLPGVSDTASSICKRALQQSATP